MKSTLDATSLVDALQTIIPGARFEVASVPDQPTLYVPADRLVETCRACRDTSGLQFSLLADLTAVDFWPREPRFEVVYHLASPAARLRLRLKVRVPGEPARLPTIAGIWPAAGWLEREVWDLFGIGFDGHPDLRRLLMPEDWEGHPLRKDYPVQIRMAARVSQPLQMTEAEFRANLDADRQARTKP